MRDNPGHRIVASGKVVAQQEFLEHLRLKNFDNLQLSSTFQLKTFQLCLQCKKMR